MNPLAVDLVCARLMGFDYRRIPMLCRALEKHDLPLSAFGYQEVLTRSNDDRFNLPLTRQSGLDGGFKPHFGWEHHIELTQASS